MKSIDEVMQVIDNKLIEKNNTIWSKIRNFLYEIFKSNKNIQTSNIKKEKNNIKKESAFEIYKSLQNNKIRIEDIPNDYLDIITEFLIKEIEIKKSKLNKIKTEIGIILYNINLYKKEKHKYLN